MLRRFANACSFEIDKKSNKRTDFFNDKKHFAIKLMESSFIYKQKLIQCSRDFIEFLLRWIKIWQKLNAFNLSLKRSKFETHFIKTTINSIENWKTKKIVANPPFPLQHDRSWWSFVMCYVWFIYLFMFHFVYLFFPECNFNF